MLSFRTQSLKKFEVIGGAVSGTEESRGKISLDRPNRQWDYPFVPFHCNVYKYSFIPTDTHGTVFFDVSRFCIDNDFG